MTSVTAAELESYTFAVNWTSPSDIASSEVEFQLTDIAPRCKLSYSITQPNVNVRMEMQLRKYSEFIIDMHSTVVLVFKCGERRIMKFDNSKWETTFTMVQGCCSADLIFDIVIAFHLKYNPLTEGEECLENRMEKLWENKNLSDVTFKCKEKSFKAHAAIVASGSPVLAAMFQHNFRENIERIVEITDIEPSTLEQLLCAIYSGDADFDDVDATELLIAADKYAMEPLKIQCAEYLSVRISVENVIQYLILANVYNVPKLHESAMMYITKNAKDICSRKDWRNLIKNHPELAFAAMELMVVEWTKSS